MIRWTAKEKDELRARCHNYIGHNYVKEKDELRARCHNYIGHNYVKEKDELRARCRPPPTRESKPPPADQP